MTITSVDEVLTPKTEAELIDEGLAVLAAATPPIDATAMQSGGILRTLLVADARALEDVHAVIAQLAASNFLDSAAALEGAASAWLDLRAKSTFDLTRIEATYTRGTRSVNVPIASFVHAQQLANFIDGALADAAKDAKRAAGSAIRGLVNTLEDNA